MVESGSEGNEEELMRSRILANERARATASARQLNNPSQNNPSTSDNSNTSNNPENNKPKGTFKERFKSFMGDWSDSNPRTTFLFYLIVLLAHCIDSFVLGYRNNVIRAIIYLIIFVISWFLIFGKNINPISREGVKKLIFAFVLALIAFLLPVLEWELLKNFMDPNLIHILQMWVGFYPMYLIVLAPTPSLEKIQKIWIGIWILVGAMFLIVGIINGGLGKLPIPESTEYFNAWDSFVSVIKFIGETIWNGFKTMFLAFTGKINQTKAFGEGRFDYATGGYYSGNEEDVEEQGVFIKNVEFSKPEYYKEDKIEVFYNLEMKTPSSNYVDAKVVCSISNSANRESEEIFSLSGEEGESLKLYNNEIVPLSCVFNNLDTGNYKVSIKVSYNYGTTSRIEAHFIDNERRNAYRAEGIDILKQYGKEVSPKAIYTQGPMKLGIEIGTQPIGIEYGASGPRIGFTLEGGWEGDIQSVNSLRLSLPEGLKLDSNMAGGCSNFSFSELIDNQNIYTFSGDIGKIEEYRSFNCKTIVSDFNKIMGNNEISTKYIKVETNYVYEYQKIQSIVIK